MLKTKPYSATDVIALVTVIGMVIYGISSIFFIPLLWYIVGSWLGGPPELSYILIAMRLAMCFVPSESFALNRWNVLALDWLMWILLMTTHLPTLMYQYPLFFWMSTPLILVHIYLLVVMIISVFSRNE